MPEQEFIDAHELARRLGYSWRHILWLARKGKLPGRKLANGGNWRFEWRAVRLMFKDKR
jgi:hypothetical protein